MGDVRARPAGIEVAAYAGPLRAAGSAVILTDVQWFALDTFWPLAKMSTASLVPEGHQAWAGMATMAGWSDPALHASTPPTSGQAFSYQPVFRRERQNPEATSTKWRRHRHMELATCAKRVTHFSRAPPVT
jgi:hypothetical protein